MESSLRPRPSAVPDESSATRTRAQHCIRHRRLRALFAIPLPAREVARLLSDAHLCRLDGAAHFPVL